MVTTIKLLLVSTLIMVPAAALAQTESVKSVAPSLASMLEASGLTASGYIDTTYSALSTSGKYAGGVINSRVFDNERNSFALNAVNLTVATLPRDGFGGLVDVMVGKDADIIASYGMIDKNTGPGAGEDQIFDLTQAYLNYTAGPLMVMGGKFNTLAGLEVIKNTGNTNISRSILFGYAIPFTHTGVRATYKISDMVSVTAGINNGWDTFEDTNSEKTGELGIALTPSKQFSLLVQGYSGEEQITNYPLSTVSGLRNLIDVVATFNATEKLSFAINADYGMQEEALLPSGRNGDATWYGVAGYMNYQFTDQWRTSLRGEFFCDEDGYRTAMAPSETEGQEQKEVTLTVAYIPLQNAELRAELRHDFSDQDVFLKANGSREDHQNSVALEALYKF